MRIIIAGSRTVTEADVRGALRQCKWAGFVSKVVSGTASGADKFGEKWARENGIDILECPADWKRHGRSAGPKRNRIMAENAEGLIAIWDGQSRGTSNMVEEAKACGLRIYIARTDLRKASYVEAHGIKESLWIMAEEQAAIMMFDGKQQEADAERCAGRCVIENYINQK